MNDCIFCKIIKKEIPSKMIYESDQIVAFYDLHPKAKHHLLIVPRKHIDSVMTMTENDQLLIGRLILDSQKIALQLHIEGYQLRCHVGEKGGQEIFHIHFHLLAN